MLTHQLKRNLKLENKIKKTISALNHVTVFLDVLMRTACITLPLGSRNLERVHSTKYLAVMTDSDLSRREHIDYVYNKIL